MAISNTTKIIDYLNYNTKATPLVVFRILFGLLMTISMIRFWYNGWIEKLYLLPSFHFHYTGFEFIQVPGRWTYLLFFICGLSALFVAIGFKYRWAILLFFLSFTYIELMDKTTYLNHYYFISVISFILIWLPANCYFSVDAALDKSLRSAYVPKWNLDLLKLMIAIVYIYAGLAKLNSDWLLRAMPLAIWLPTKFEVPLIGALMHEKWVHYLFSWTGAFYDLFIVFFLMYSRTRIPAFITVIVFHLLTRVLFPIGMFPYIMIVSTLLFFSAEFHDKVLNIICKIVRRNAPISASVTTPLRSTFYKISIPILFIFMMFQLLLPLRSLGYNGNLYWNEQGYRFSWRVMLMEKTGYANFKIVDGVTGKRFYVQNDDFLTPTQQKQMATQPDFILEYAHFLGKTFASHGHQQVEVYVESYAALNGRKSQLFISPEVDLMTIASNSILCKNHIIPLDE